MPLEGPSDPGVVGAEQDWLSCPRSHLGSTDLLVSFSLQMLTAAGVYLCLFGQLALVFSGIFLFKGVGSKLLVVLTPPAALSIALLGLFSTLSCLLPGTA